MSLLSSLPYREPNRLSNRQSGGVMIMMAIATAVLIGFLGLTVDLGRLFVTKTELQSAMDACALAAAAELRPAVLPPDTQAITRALNAGITAGNRNKVGFQGTTAGITDSDVLFSDRLSNNTTTFPFGYVSAASASPATARFAMCARAQTGITTWFMQVLEGFLGQPSDTKSVGAFATASQMAAQTNCAVPLGMCSQDAAPNYGFTRGQWFNGRFDSGGGLTGSYNWIDYSPPGGGASELAGQLTGQGQCNLNVTKPVGQSGILGNAASKAWNTRFGIYQGSEGPADGTPDFTGYSYTPANWPSKNNAYPDFVAKRAAFASYGDTEDTIKAGDDLTGLDVKNGHVATHGVSGQHSQYGADRRVVTVPVVNCAAWASSQTVPIDAWACVLLLHPIAKPSDVVYMEFLGMSTTPGNPCSTSGLAGGTAGPQVPVLVH